jgi:hypothetical protein
LIEQDPRLKKLIFELTIFILDAEMSNVVSWPLC